MGDLDKNINRKDDLSSYGKITVNPIEKDKKEEGATYASLQNATKPQVFATLAAFLKKMLTAFPNKGKDPVFPTDQQHLLKHVLAFRQLLLTLSKEDRSHNPDFTQQLSELWHNLLEDCNSLATSPLASHPVFDKLKFFILQVQRFPLGADHTLGFYLSNYAGQEWIPFPFMQLLQGLHEEHQASPTVSVLHNWLSLLSETLRSAGFKIT